MSKLYFRFSPMNSGKSTALIQIAHNYEERGQKVLVVKPSVDTKSSYVLSRIGAKRAVDIHATPDADLYEKVTSYGEDIDCVLVDEVQFCTPEQVEQLFRLAVLEDIPVIGYGIRTDFRTKGFPGSLRMMELAHSIEEMKTICRCGVKALFNGRKVNGVFVREGAQVAIDGEVEYESLCGVCYLTKVGDIHSA